MPADPRTLAEEAIRRSGLLGAPDTLTLARALIEALDEGDRLVALLGDHGLDPDSAVDLTTRSALELETHRARAAERDRDALLADLPHAIGKCGCLHFEESVEGGSIVISGGWAKEHCAAIERLEARIK